MPSPRPLEIRDCTPLAQTLELTPPPVVHGALGLALAALAAAVLWAAAAKVDLVVEAVGQIRPEGVPIKVYSQSGAKLDGRVAEVHAAEGDRVARGALLLRLDTTRIDAEIELKQRCVGSTRLELESIDRLAELTERQHEVARAKAEAELAQARAEITRAADVQRSDIRRAELEQSLAADTVDRLRSLAAGRTVPAAQLVQAEAKLHDAAEKLRQARLPLDASRLDVLAQQELLIEREYLLKRGELDARRLEKQAALQQSEKELESLRNERSRAELKSPIDGIVTSGQFRVGDVLELGRPAFEIAPQRAFCFEALLPSRDVGLLRDGMPARLRIDAFDYQIYGTLPATVAFISPDARDARSADQSAAVYRVRLTLGETQLGHGAVRGNVKLGMAGRVEIVTQRQTLLWMLARRIHSKISFG